MAREMIRGEPVYVGGIPINDGDHLCALHKGQAERDELLMPYLKRGVQRGDICLCVTRNGESQALTLLVAQDGVEFPALQLLEPQDTYLQSGAFEPELMLDVLDRWSQQTFAENPSGFARVAADMSWAKPFISPAFVVDLMDFESRVTQWVRTYPQVGVCMYDLNVFGGDVIIQAIKFHPKVRLSGVVLDNPYYLDPSATASSG